MYLKKKSKKIRYSLKTLLEHICLSMHILFMNIIYLITLTFGHDWCEDDTTKQLSKALSSLLLLFLQIIIPGKNQIFAKILKI